jgi:hypothetical protein
MAKTATKRGAKKSENKSAAVRGYLEANPSAKNPEVIEALKALGVDVSPNYVSIIRSQQKKRSRKSGTRGRKPAAATSNGHLDVEQLRAAAVLIKACQGIDGARKAIAVAEKIADALR